MQKELGNYWSVTPGSQILWTTAVANVLDGERYGNPSGDLRNLLLGKYGPIPFYQPEEWIYEKVLGEDWRKVLEEEGGVEEIADMDLAHERYSLAEQIGTEPTVKTSANRSAWWCFSSLILAWWSLMRRRCPGRVRSTFKAYTFPRLAR